MCIRNFICLSLFSFLFRNGCSLTTTPYIGARASRGSQLSGHHQNRNDVSGSAPGKGPYVPSGLTPADYQKLKKDEEAKNKKMNFGAWGPRFKQTGVPDGAWMAMPSLWTAGFNMRARPKPLDVEAGASSSRIRRVRDQIGSAVDKNGLGLVMTYIAIDVLLAAFSMWKATELTIRQALWIICQVSLFRRAFYISAFWKVYAAKGALALALTPIMNQFLERVNRRQLWTKRRTFLTSTLVAVVALALWAVLLKVTVGYF
jgi:hypothetical protein